MVPRSPEFGELVTEVVIDDCAGGIKSRGTCSEQKAELTTGSSSWPITFITAANVPPKSTISGAPQGADLQ